MNQSNARRAGFKPVLLSVFTVLATSGALMNADAGPADATGDTASIAVISGYIPTFGAAVTGAGLAPLLDGAGPYTVFVPAEGAFARLAPGALDNLLLPANKASLQALLRAHIVAGKVLVADLKDNDTLVTLQGTTLLVSRDASGVSINGARMMTSDITASNGVMHVVKAVLGPGN